MRGSDKILLGSSCKTSRQNVFGKRDQRAKEIVFFFISERKAQQPSYNK